MVVDDLCFGYEGGERVFSSFSLSLGDGEHVLVLAPPGSGKTTLAKILTGPVPAYSGGSLSGSISMDGRNLLDIPIAERMEKVSRISQDTDEMLLFSTVEEEALERSVKALESAAGFIQARLAKVLKTRNTPVLRFVADNSWREGERVNVLIDEALGR